MPVYDYSALDSKGKTVSGIIDADGAAAARQKIRAAGNYPVNVREVRDISAEKSDRPTISLSSMFTRVRPAEVAIVTRQLATLIGAGFPLVSALEALQAQIRSSGLKKIIATIRGDIVEGSSFANALEKHIKIFSPIYVNMVRAGESSGTLEIVLERLADITEKQQALESRVITAMIYPLLIMMAGMLILTFLFIYVIPNITSIFEDMRQQLPLPTQILITISDLFKSFWWILVLLIAAFMIGLRQLRQSAKGRLWMDTTALRLPIAGSMIRRLAAARFARTLGSLLENGVSMLPSLAIVKNIVGNIHIAEVIENATAEVGKGQGLGKSLDVSNTFPPIAIQMIQVGEQSGNLEEMLNKVADVFEKEVETTILRLTALLEPVMVMLMAGVVLFIVLSICLPIFEMRTLVR
jgi:general secretion pathway protein F